MEKFMRCNTINYTHFYIWRFSLVWKFGAGLSNLFQMEILKIISFLSTLSLQE